MISNVSRIAYKGRYFGSWLVGMQFNNLCTHTGFSIYMARKPMTVPIMDPKIHPFVSVSPPFIIIFVIKDLKETDGLKLFN